MKLEYNFVVDKTLSKTKNNPNRNIIKSNLDLS